MCRYSPASRYRSPSPRRYNRSMRQRSLSPPMPPPRRRSPSPLRRRRRSPTPEPRRWQHSASPRRRGMSPDAWRHSPSPPHRRASPERRRSQHDAARQRRISERSVAAFNMAQSYICLITTNCSSIAIWMRCLVILRLDYYYLSRFITWISFSDHKVSRILIENEAWLA